MKIIGGIYDEVCREPNSSQTVGSGLRAAVAVSRAARDLTLHSRASHTQLEEARQIAAGSHFALAVKERRRSIRFSYDNPLARPYIDSHDPLDVEDIQLDDDVVLAYGMIDARPRIRARRIIIDPQRPGSYDLSPHFEFDRSSTLAIVANETEIRGLAGKPKESIPECGLAVLKRYGAEVVVIKRGALGALVVFDGEIRPVGSFPIERVWPIGSGDVFSAVFALAWGQEDRTPVEAARIASQATAAACRESHHGPIQAVSAAAKPLLPDSIEEKVGEPPVLYLAGPFFSFAQRWMIDLMRHALVKLGAEVFSPYHEVGDGPPDVVAPLDLAAIERATAVVAIIDDLDAGTLFEIGYAKALGKSIVAFGENTSSSDLTMLIGSGVELHDDLATAAYRAVWVGMR